MDRRAFVKGCIAAAGVGAAAAAGVSMAAPAIIPRPAPQPYVNYYGLHVVGGPAPRGIPLVPLKLVDGVFFGNPAVNGPGGINVLNWYNYCGHGTAPGLAPNFKSTNQMTYYISSDLLAQVEAQGVSVWFKDLVGQPVKASDFKPGYGAGFIWRSENQTSENYLKGMIIRGPRETVFTPQDPLFEPPLGPNGKPHYIKGAKAIPDPDWPTVRKDFLYIGPEGSFVAVNDICTHFCCVPGWKTAPFSKSVADTINTHRVSGEDIGGVAWDRMYCPCHGSVYDPWQLAYWAFQPDTLVSPIGGT
jgi:Rieske Fe-S protein